MVRRDDGSVVPAKRIVSDNTTEYVLYQTEDRSDDHEGRNGAEGVDYGQGHKEGGLKWGGGVRASGTYDFTNAFENQRLTAGGSSVVGHTISMRGWTGQDSSIQENVATGSSIGAEAARDIHLREGPATESACRGANRGQIGKELVANAIACAADAVSGKEVRQVRTREEEEEEEEEEAEEGEEEEEMETVMEVASFKEEAKRVLVEFEVQDKDVDADSLALFRDVFAGGSSGQASVQGKEQAKGAQVEKKKDHPLDPKYGPTPSLDKQLENVDAQKATKFKTQSSGGEKKTAEQNGPDVIQQEKEVNADPVAPERRMTKKEWGSLDSFHAGAGRGFRDREKSVREREATATLASCHKASTGTERPKETSSCIASHAILKTGAVESSLTGDRSTATRREWGSLESLHHGWGSRPATCGSDREKSSSEGCDRNLSGGKTDDGGKRAEAEGRRDNDGITMPNSAAAKHETAEGRSGGLEECKHASDAADRAEHTGHPSLSSARLERGESKEFKSSVIDLPEDEQVRLSCALADFLSFLLPYCAYI